MEVTTNTFRSALDKGDSAWVDCVEGTGSHLLGLLRVFGADLPVLGYMQALDGAGAERGGHLDAGAMPEQDVPAIRPAAPGHHFELSLEPARQVIKGHFNLGAVDLAGGRQVLGDDPALEVLVEQRLVQQIDVDGRGESELARLEDDVQPPHGPEQKLLRRAQPEAHQLALLVLDHVEVVHSPPLIAELRADVGHLLLLSHGGGIGFGHGGSPGNKKPAEAGWFDNKKLCCYRGIQYYCRHRQHHHYIG